MKTPAALAKFAACPPFSRIRSEGWSPIESRPCK